MAHSKAFEGDQEAATYAPGELQPAASSPSRHSTGSLLAGGLYAHSDKSPSRVQAAENPKARLWTEAFQGSDGLAGQLHSIGSLTLNLLQ